MRDGYKGMPTMIRVGCYQIDLVVGTYEDHEQEGTYGHFNSFQHRISIRPGLIPLKVANTFIHEVLHAIHWVYGLMRPGSSGPAAPDEPTEEEYTTQTANGLCAFWQDNPEAMKWWVSNVALDPQKPPKDTK